MTNTEVEEFFVSWWSTSGKVFRYVREFMFDEYILISKRSYEPMFVVDITSTYRLPNMTKEEMSEKLRNGVLVYSSDPKMGISCTDMKTGGCECGSWWDSTMRHADYCKLRFRNR